MRRLRGNRFPNFAPPGPPRVRNQSTPRTSCSPAPRWSPGKLRRWSLPPVRIANLGLRIAHLTQTGSEAVSPLREQIAYLSRLIGILAVAIGLIFFAISRILGVPFWEDFIFAIGIIVALVPEWGLLPTLTLAAGPGYAANGKTPRSDPLSPISRDTRLDHRDLYRQDRHVDTKPNDGTMRRYNKALQ